MDKKFMIYEIKITYADGRVEYRVRNGYSTAKYDDMKKLYKEVKEEVSSENCKIALLGVDFRGGRDMVLEDNFTKISEEKNKIYETSFAEYANQIKDILKNMRIKRDYHYQVMDAISKKDSIVDHKIETFRNKEWENEIEMLAEKLSIFDMAEELKNERRMHKNELKILSNIKEKIDLKEMYDVFNSISINNKKFKYLDDAMIKNLDMIKEVYFSGEVDRIKKIKSLKKKYNKIKVDAKNSKLICYNKCEI